MGVETADAVGPANSAAGEPIVGESAPAAEAASDAEPVSCQACVRGPAEMSPGEVPATEMSPAEVPATEVTGPPEVAAIEPAEMTEMHATEVSASEPPEVAAAESPEVAAAETAEMTAAPKPAEMTATAEMAAAMTAAESTVPKSKSFANHARHHIRRERYFEAEPERHRRCENFRPLASHGVLLPPALRNYDPSLLRAQPTHGRFRAFHGNL
ncbi:MAG: hypothetical protein WBW81_11530 [Methylocella sp.]